MRIILLLTVAALFSWVPAVSQQHDDHDHHHEGYERCGTMPYLEMLKISDPGLEGRMAEMERLTEAWIATKGKEEIEGVDNVITIPVVVHILYSNANQNISDAQVHSQIDVLNRDFRRMNTDTTLTPGMFKPVAADVEIEFCLASRDPQGNFTTGITRTQTSVNTFGLNNNAKFTSQGGKDAWPSSSYLNIWVCNLGSGLLGYAQFPGGNPATDGVVILYDAFGTVGNVQYPFHKGRTTTHEVGHWLNLYHIWGDDNGTCSGTDYVGDTPNQGDNYYGCPSHPQYSCGSEDMFMNYMDYVDDACANTFTLGQKARMRAAISMWRSSLQTSLGCVLQPPVANFQVDRSTTVSNCPVNFTDLSVGSPQSWSWHFENGTPSTSNVQNPQNIQFSQPGNWAVTLIAQNGMGSDTIIMPGLIHVSDTLRPNTHFAFSKRFACTSEPVSFTDQSEYCPTSWEWQTIPSTVTYLNGTGPNSRNPVIRFDVPGAYTVSLTATNVNGQQTFTQPGLILAGGIPLPLDEDFESNSLAWREWTTVNPNGDFTWQIATAPRLNTSNKAAMVPIFGTNSLSYKDGLVSAPLNFSGMSEVYLHFRHAYAQYQTSYTDSLFVLVSTDCGQTWTSVLRLGDDGSGSFATSTPKTSYFTPAGPDDWCGSGYGSPCRSVDLTAWAGMENVQIKFESFSYLSNNIYLDDINISNLVSVPEHGKDPGMIRFYPNPSDGILTIDLQGLNGKFSLRLNNLTGSAVLVDEVYIDKGNYLRRYDLSALPSGMYLLNLVGDSQNYTGKVILR